MHNTSRSHTSRRVPARSAMLLLALAACVTGLLCASTPALAEFSRPYIGQITSTPTGLNGAQVPFGGLAGLTVDPLGGNVYISGEGLTDEFNSSDEFIERLTGLSNGLVFDDESGRLENIGEARGYHAAVDNSTSPTDKARGDIYFTSSLSGEEGGGGRVRRVDSTGVSSPFTCLENGKTPEYINGAGEFSGKPGETWGEYGGDHELTSGIAVDSGGASVASAGDIYVAIENQGEAGPATTTHVDEFTSEGCFVRELTQAMVPERITNDSGSEGVFVPGIVGVAVDSTDGDVLVQAHDASDNEAVDEFSESGEFLGKITGISKTDNFSSVEGSGFIPATMGVNAEGDLYLIDYEFTGEYGEKGEPVTRRVVDRFGKGAFYPRVVTGAVSGVRSGTVTLNGVVDGEGRGLEECRFEYVSEAALKANDVDALQTLSVSGASGGGFSLSLDGQSTAAQGTGDLVGPAEGSGDLIEGANVITGLTTSSGTFIAGEEISGAGIPTHTTIQAVPPGVIILSANANASGGPVALSAVSDEIAGLLTSSGSFVEGQEISGAGIPAGTTITALNRIAGTLTLSAEVTAGGSGVALSSAIPYDPRATQVSGALESF